jgi:hypothetical protein
MLDNLQTSLVHVRDTILHGRVYLLRSTILFTAKPDRSNQGLYQ